MLVILLSVMVILGLSIIILPLLVEIISDFREINDILSGETHKNWYDY